MNFLSQNFQLKLALPLQFMFGVITQYLMKINNFNLLNKNAYEGVK